MAVSRQKLVTVRVDEDLLARATAGKPRGWISEAVRGMLEAAAAGDVPVLELGPVDDDLSNTTWIGNSVTGVTVGDGSGRVKHSVTGVTGDDGSPRTKRAHSPTCKCAVCQ